MKHKVLEISKEQRALNWAKISEFREEKLHPLSGEFSDKQCSFYWIVSYFISPYTRSNRKSKHICMEISKEYTRISGKSNPS